MLVVSLNPTLQKTVIFDSPLETGGVNRSSEYTLDASGKGGNTARVLTQLGNRCRYLTQAGGVMRDYFLQLLKEDGVETEWVDSESEIRFCYTLISRNPFSSTEIVENGEPVSPGTDKLIREKFSRLIPDTEYLAIAGSKTSGFSESIYLDMIAEAETQGTRSVLDMKGDDLVKAMVHSPFLVKINLYEFISTFQPDLMGDTQEMGERFYAPAERKSRKLFREYGTRFILTNGEKDILICDGEEINRITPGKASPVNPIGSGDSFTAGVISQLHRGATLADAAAVGEECARKNVELMKPGTIE